MNTKWSGMLTLALFFVITAFGFLFWVFGLAIVWIILKALNFTTDLMAMIEALSAALAAAAVFGGGFIAYRELSEVSNARYMDIADRLFDELNSPENIDARKRVYLNLPASPEEGIKKMDPEDQAAMKKVLNSLDRVAFLTQAKWIPDEVIMPWMHPMIAKSWEKLEPYVNYERQRRHEPYYYKYVSELARRCSDWQKKHLSDWKVTWIGDAL